MKITNVETYYVDVPLRQRTITDSQSRVSSVEFIQVRVDTDEGITGWGFNWNYTRGMRAVKVIIDETYTPVMLGRDPLFYRELCRDLQYTNHFIGRVGVTRVGLCAINMALWDIRLKMMDCHCGNISLPARIK